MAWAVDPRGGLRSQHPSLRPFWRALCLLGVLLLLIVLLGPLTGRWRLVPVMTGSMDPTHPAGSLVLATPMASSELAVDDVVLFDAPVPGKPTVMHRIVTIEEATFSDGTAGAVYRTKGDANAAVDPWRLTLSSAQAWQVRNSMPHLGRIALALQQRSGQTAVLGSIVLLFSVVALRRIWQQNERPALARS